MLKAAANLQAALKIIYPTVHLAQGRDYTVDASGNLATWKIKRVAQPTVAQLASASAQVAAAQQASAHAAVVLKQLKADLITVFTSWSKGQQYDFEGARQAMVADLAVGDITAAIQGVSTFRPADASLQPHRMQILALLTAAAAALG
jgi:hypothetical protein